MKSNLYYIVYIWGLCLLLGCKPESKGFEPDAGSANFSHVIAIGGSFMAGYQDGALSQKGQQNSIPALISEQMKLAEGGNFHQVLLQEGQGAGLNLKPWESYFVGPSKLGYKKDCKGVTSLSPVKSNLTDVVALTYLNSGDKSKNNNWAVPFASLQDYSNVELGLPFGQQNKNPFYNRIASNPGTSTILSDIQDQNPSFIISWLGMDDIYNYASKGGAHISIPSPESFEQNLNLILAPYFQKGIKGVMATIPDFRNFPFYTLVAWNNANLTQSQADSLNDVYSTNSSFDHIRFTSGKNGFVVADPNEPSGYRKMKDGEYITLSVPLDSMKCYKYGLLVKVIDNRYSLIESEVQILDQAIKNYNQIIIQKAAQYGFAVANMEPYFNKVKNGIKWDGVDFNMDFVTGGFLSLDAYHPNQKGYGLIANEFIKAINQKYGAHIPQTNCSQCDGVLFN